MSKKMHPQFMDMVLMSEQENGKIWSREFELIIVDKNQKEGFMKKKNVISEVITLIVCSKEYVAANLDTWSKSEISTFHLQEVYDFNQAKEYARNLIDGIGDVSLETFYRFLKQYFILDPKEWTKGLL